MRLSTTLAPARVEALSRAFRTLPVPMIGRVHGGVLYFDLRCLDDEEGFLKQLAHLPDDAKLD
jgi:L-seryl-tRNA(Ser) seleniumtransferase